jgi:hypothetical protein
MSAPQSLSTPGDPSALSVATPSLGGYPASFGQAPDPGPSAAPSAPPPTSFQFGTPAGSPPPLTQPSTPAPNPIATLLGSLFGPTPSAPAAGIFDRGGGTPDRTS